MTLQHKIQGLLDDMVARDRERGVQATLYFRGRFVVDAWAGTADYRSGLPVTGDTLFPVFSTTKGVAATIIHRLTERGILDYDTPIATWWPEFGARGKERITLRHALGHTSGLPLVPPGIGPSEIGNWDLMCARLADSAPISAPGEREEYHAVTFGWIVGEVARRAAGRSFSELWHDEIVAPLGLESTMFCGLPAELEPRVAWLEEPPAETPAELPVAADSAQPEEPSAIPHWLWPLGEWMNRSDARRTCIPASSGIMNARAIARHYAALLPGGIDGVELLPPARVEIARTPTPATSSEEPPSFGLGYGLAGTAFGHGGYGGSLGLADPAAGWAIGFTRNRFGEDNSAQIVLDAVKAELQAES
jgi:CubicO group peptidase (beta-lactamase class C family)